MSNDQLIFIGKIVVSILAYLVSTVIVGAIVTPEGDLYILPWVMYFFGGVLFVIATVVLWR